MGKYFIILLLMYCSWNRTYAVPTTITDLIPKSYIIIDSAQTDFNNDGLLDFALVVRAKDSIILKTDTVCFGDSVYYPKQIMIFFAERNKQYKLSITTSEIFGACNWGIQGSDPFRKIGVKKNCLTISLMTGGTLRCELLYTVRFQNNDWYIIGATSNVYQVPYSDLYVTDIDLITGNSDHYVLRERKSSYNKRVKPNLAILYRHKKFDYKRIKIPLKPLLKINDLIPETEIDPLWDWAKG